MIFRRRLSSLLPLIAVGLIQLGWVRSLQAIDFSSRSEDFRNAVSAAFDPSTPAKRESVKELHAELKSLVAQRTTRSLERARNVGYKLALSHLRQRRVQEAIWALDRAGLFGHGEYVAQKLRSHLSFDAIQSHTPVDRGVSQSLKVSLPPFTSIAKLESSDKINNDITNQSAVEVFAYELDRYIGLSRVSTTVLADFPEYKQLASFQYMLRGSDSDIYYRDSYLPNLRFIEDVWVFDYLLDNSDRHDGNSLLTAERELVLIDHGRSFWSTRQSGPRLYARQDSVKLRDDIAVDPDLLRNLHDIPLNEFEKLFEPLVGKVNIQAVIRRIKEVRRVYARPKGDSLRRRGWELQNVRVITTSKSKRQRDTIPNKYLAFDREEFAQDLKISSSGQLEDSETNWAARRIAEGLNDPHQRRLIFRDFAENQNLARFVQSFADLLIPEARVAYIRAVNRRELGQGKNFKGAIQSCKIAVAGGNE